MEPITIRNLNKQYKDFSLRDISFSLPMGSIMGFIGENGAGKSTTIKNILGLHLKDKGEVEVFGRRFTGREKELKELLGVALDDSFFAPGINGAQIEKALSSMYSRWDREIYYKYLERFSLNPKKCVKDYSKGMKMKLSLAAALSHGAKLLILDEVTSGLDPVVRSEVLELFLEFIQDEEHSILISSHILSDLEKICDYITFIHGGRIVFSENKDELLESYVIVKGSMEQIAQLEEQAVIGIEKNAFSTAALVKTNCVPDGMIREKATIEDIMLMWKRGK